MTLRAEFAALPADFNNFLFAPIGEEASGGEVTVYSALTRVGIDPWAETARLSAMPRDAAALTLTTLINRIPGARWQEAEASGIAARLVDLLPRDAKPPSPPPQLPEIVPKAPAHPARSRGWIVVLIGLAAMALVLWSIGGPHGYGP